MSSSSSDDDGAQKWTLGEMFKAADRWMTGLQLPQMEKPEGLGRQYSYPSDVSVIKSNTLGTLSLQLTAFYTYTLQLLGREESELGALEEVFSVKLGIAMDEEASRRAGDGRTVKEVLRALALSNDEDVKKMYQALLARRHRVKLLETQANIYKEQLVRLSREQSRREAEAHVMR